MKMRVIQRRLEIFWMLLIGASPMGSNPSSENCENRRECYFEGSQTQLNWSLAREACEAKNSTLPVIRTADKQTRLHNYLRNYQNITGRPFIIWTSGKKGTEQRWINGQLLTNPEHFKFDKNQDGYTHFALQTRKLKEGLVLKPENPLHPAWYICQYNGSRCQENDSLNLTNSCIKIKGDGRSSWYRGRNECLADGGDLAILGEQDPQHLLQFAQNNESFFRVNTNEKKDNFWIGLEQKTSWLWHFNEKEEVIKYSNWSQNSPSSTGDCISINSPSGQWVASDCNEEKLVICIREMVSTKKKSPTRTSKQTSTHSPATSTKMDSTVHATTTKKSSKDSEYPLTATPLDMGLEVIATNTKKSWEETPELDVNCRPSEATTADASRATENSRAIYIVIVIFSMIVLCILVVIFVIRRRQNLSNARNNLHDNKSVPMTNDYQSTAPPIYAELATTYVGGYSDDDVNKDAYSSLNFEKEATYAEPMIKKTNIETAETQETKANVQHKIGPKGDAYALPNINPASPVTRPTKTHDYENLCM